MIIKAGQNVEAGEQIRVYGVRWNCSSWYVADRDFVCVPTDHVLNERKNNPVDRLKEFFKVYGYMN